MIQSVYSVKGELIPILQNFINCYYLILSSLILLIARNFPLQSSRLSSSVMFNITLSPYVICSGICGTGHSVSRLAGIGRSGCFTVSYWICFFEQAEMDINNTAISITFMITSPGCKFSMVQIGTKLIRAPRLFWGGVMTHLNSFLVMG